MGYKRLFVEFGKRKENILDSNLTELKAARTVNAGFINHTDWMGHIARYAYAMKRVQKERPDRILDVGCGEMEMCYFFWKNRFSPPDGFEYWGMDLRAQQRWIDKELPANKAKDHDPCPVKCDVTLVNMDVCLSDPTKIASWPGNFPVVVCMETLEHVPRSHAPVLMGRLFNWTEPGGILILSTPNAGVSDSTAENHLDPATGESREWDYHEKIKMAIDAGFVHETSYGVFGRMDRIKPRLIADGKLAEDGKTWLDPVIKAMREFMNPSVFLSTVVAAYPESCNNSLMVFRRPL